MSRLPLATFALPGSGGLLKAVPEDFVVEEVPAYDPSGEGEHLFVWLEKRGRDTQEVARALAAALGVSEREVGTAGQKDRQGVTRQLFSVPARAEEKLGAFALEGVSVLWAKRHGNKLRTGHLKGNRFRIRLRDIKDAAAGRAALAHLAAHGVPNYFGDQRFGRGDDNAEKGKRLILGQRLERAPTAFLRKLYLSAYQSLLFNQLLSARVEEGSVNKALLGDVLRKTDSGGLFVCADPAVDQPRVDAFEVSPAGPLFGPKMPRASAAVAEREAALLAQEGVTLEDFKRGRDETEGGRRPYRIPLADASWEDDGADAQVSFFLPKGSYATVVLREVMKTDGATAS